MASGVVNVNLGFSLGGGQEVKYSLNHTGKGYVSVIANIPYLAKLKEATSQELPIRPTAENFESIKKLIEAIGFYEHLLAAKNSYGLVVNDEPTFDLTKIKELSKSKNINVFNRFFAAKASISIADARRMLQELLTALRVETTRSGNL